MQSFSWESSGILVCYSVNLILNLVIFLIARRLSESTSRHYDITKQKFIGKMIQKAKHMDRGMTVGGRMAIGGEHHLQEHMRMCCI